MAQQSILRLPDVKRLTGLSRSSIYSAIKAGTFPRPVELGARAVGWISNQIEDWIANRVIKNSNDEKSSASVTRIPRTRKQPS
jgi:prophage regulatory protein